MGPTRHLTHDPCPLGLPEILTAAHIRIPEMGVPQNQGPPIIQTPIRRALIIARAPEEGHTSLQKQPHIVRIRINSKPALYQPQTPLQDP